MYRTFIALFAVLLFSGCGYLDQDLELSDEEFEAGLLGMSGEGYGSGSVGCGGFSFHGVGRAGGGGRSYHSSRRRDAKGTVSFGEMEIWEEYQDDPDTVVLLEESELSALQIVAQEVEDKRHMSAGHHLEPTDVMMEEPVK